MEDQGTGSMRSGQNSEFKYRLVSLEKDCLEVKQQLHYYVSVKENDLQLKGIQTTVNRIELEVHEAKKNIGEVNNQILIQEMDVQKQNANLRESQASLQIRVLWGTVSTIITIITSILVGYLTHIIH